MARDGITTYKELVDAQQNVYNVGYDLANLLAFLGLQADGDLVTQKLSIGCDATGRTSFNRVLTGSQPGLVGHNKFEGDTSLTRYAYTLKLLWLDRLADRFVETTSSSVRETTSDLIQPSSQA